MGFNSNGTGLFGGGGSAGGAFTGAVNGLSAWGADPTKVALGGTLLADTVIDGSGGPFSLQLTGQFIQRFDGVMKYRVKTFGSKITGMGFYDFNDVALARISVNAAIGDINIETHPGAATPEIVVNYDTQDVTIGRLGINVVPDATYHLDVTGRIHQTSNETMALQASSAAGVIGIDFMNAVAAVKGFFTVDITTGEIRMGGASGGYLPKFFGNGIQAFSIDSSGNILVGTGVASSQLVINGSGANAGIFSPAYASGSSNISSFKDFGGTTRLTLDMSAGATGSLALVSGYKFGVGLAGAPAEAIDIAGNIGMIGSFPYFRVFVTGVTGAGTYFMQFGINLAAGASGPYVTMQLPAARGFGLQQGGVTNFLLETNGNISMFSAGDFGGGTHVLSVANATLVPPNTPVGGGILYAEGGALKWKGSAGTVTIVAPA